MRRPIFQQTDLEAIRAARWDEATPRISADGPCARCRQDIAPDTLYARDRDGKPVHIGACPVPGPFTEARVEFERRQL